MGEPSTMLRWFTRPRVSLFHVTCLTLGWIVGGALP